MMTSRRHILAGIAGLGVISANYPAKAFPAGLASAKVVIVGGGFGGASAAVMLKQLAPSLSVTLVEPNSVYTACPFSNLVIGGERNIAAQRFRYEGLSGLGVDVVHDRAIDIQTEERIVYLKGGGNLIYDRLILSPGIDMRWNAIAGYDEAAAALMPHAWKAGDQTLLLRRQLDDMEDGGLVVISAPRAPFRCPPGPYERASLIAHYLKTRKPRSKLLVLDAKDSFSKMTLFQEAWAEKYPDHLEWRGATDDGGIVEVSPGEMTLSSDFETVKADVANVIPPQKAGWIADRAGVSDETGWCPIDPQDFSSTLQNDVHVIGDATIAAPMPKSAFSANLQAKIAAISIVRSLSGLALNDLVLANTCYSFTGPDEAVSITGVYHTSAGAISSAPGAGGVSPLGADMATRQMEAGQARDWFSAIIQQAFAS